MSMNVVSQRRHSPDISARKEWGRVEKLIEEANRERGTKGRFDRDDVRGTKLREELPVPNFDLELGVPFARRVVYLPYLRGDRAY